MRNKLKNAGYIDLGDARNPGYKFQWPGSLFRIQDQVRHKLFLTRNPVIPVTY